MPKRTNYTSRTLDLLRREGFEADIAERFIPGANIRKDLFGIIDIVAFKNKTIAGVQSTSYQQRKNHEVKILESKHTLPWLKTGAKLWLITWKREKRKRGGIAFRYVPVVDIFARKDDDTVEVTRRSL